MAQNAGRVANVSPSLSQSIAGYLATLPAEERSVAAPELNRFARWYGQTRPIASVTPSDVERYQNSVSGPGQNPAERLEPLRAFLSYAARQKLTGRNLAVALNLRPKRRAERAGATEAAAAQPSAPSVEMTREGRDQLVAELERLENVERPRVSAEVARARADGDIRENAPYHAAKETLGRIQGRINELRALLAAAQVVENNGSSERAGFGSVVVLHDLDEDEEVTYTLVGPGEVNIRSGKISIQSPVGRALADRRVGDVVEVETPAGRTRFQIKRILHV